MSEPEQKTIRCVGGPMDGTILPNASHPIIQVPVKDRFEFVNDPGVAPTTHQTVTTVTYTKHTFWPCWDAMPVRFFLCDLRDPEEYELDLRMLFEGSGA